MTTSRRPQGRRARVRLPGPGAPAQPLRQARLRRPHGDGLHGHAEVRRDELALGAAGDPRRRVGRAHVGVRLHGGTASPRRSWRPPTATRRGGQPGRTSGIIYALYGGAVGDLVCARWQRSSGSDAPCTKAGTNEDQGPRAGRPRRRARRWSGLAEPASAAEVEPPSSRSRPCRPCRGSGSCSTEVPYTADQQGLVRLTLTTPQPATHRAGHRRRQAAPGGDVTSRSRAGGSSGTTTRTAAPRSPGSRCAGTSASRRRSA